MVTVSGFLRFAGLAAFLALVLSACGPVAESDPAVTEIPPDLGWRDIPLADVRTGDTFTLADFSGKVLIVDLMAVWCSNCLLQQHQLQIASAEWADGEVVIVSLDVDSNETATILLRHVEQHNIMWQSAIAPQPMVDRLVEEFGPIATAVTATPLIFVDGEGEAELIGRGLKPKRVLLELVAERQ